MDIYPTLIQFLNAPSKKFADAGAGAGAGAGAAGAGAAGAGATGPCAIPS